LRPQLDGREPVRAAQCRQLQIAITNYTDDARLLALEKLRVEASEHP
jgi:hypothetical protein